MAISRRYAIPLALAVTLLPGAGLPGRAQPQKPLQKLMLAKLDSSKAILEGIALADYRKIQANAEKLIQISKTAEWVAYKTPRYELHSNEFRRAAESLIQKAEAKNLDGVTLAYFDLTMSCVRCHQYVREVRDARLGSPRDANTNAAE